MLKRPRSQSLNLYNYALNNPMKYIDPTGLDCVYFNDAGNGPDTDKDPIDHNSNPDECAQNGGDWVNGTTSASQIHYNASTDTFDIQSSSTFHDYNTIAHAPGPQNDGTLCSGSCDTPNGYSSSWKFPSSTFNLGVAVNGAFGGGAVTGFAGVLIDSHAHVGVYWGGGVGGGEGLGGL